MLENESSGSQAAEGAGAKTRPLVHLVRYKPRGFENKRPPSPKRGGSGVKNQGSGSSKIEGQQDVNIFFGSERDRNFEEDALERKNKEDWPIKPVSGASSLKKVSAPEALARSEVPSNEYNQGDRHEVNNAERKREEPEDHQHFDMQGTSIGSQFAKWLIGIGAVSSLIIYFVVDAKKRKAQA